MQFELEEPNQEPALLASRAALETAVDALARTAPR
jgi:hypothetical protein